METKLCLSFFPDISSFFTIGGYGDLTFFPISDGVQIGAVSVCSCNGCQAVGAWGEESVLTLNLIIVKQIVVP